MITWHNVYAINGKEHRIYYGACSAADAAFWANNSRDQIRVEMHIDGHWHRPPVGMKSAQASHQWIRRFYTCGIRAGVITIAGGPWELEARQS